MAFLITLLSVVLEYGMLFFLFLFVIKSLNYLFKDIRKKSREIRYKTMQTKDKFSRDFENFER